MDRLRILASIDIVSGHVTGTHLLGGIGLPIFLLTSVSMCVHRPTTPRLGDFAARRVEPVLLPWLVWSGVYAVWLVVRALLNNLSPWESFEPRMLLSGTAIHLWFMPFILVANLTVVALAGQLRRWSTRQVIALALALGVVSLIGCAHLRQSIPTAPPVMQWLFSIPCIPLGLAIGRTVSLASQRTRPLLVLTAMGAATWIFGRLHPNELIVEWTLLQRFGLAIALLCTAALWTSQPDHITRTLVRNTFGVYLVHPLLVMIAGECRVWLGPPLLSVCIVYAASLGLCMLLQRTRLGRFV